MQSALNSTPLEKGDSKNDYWHSINGVTIERVPGADILPNWDRIEPHVIRVLARIDSGHSVEDVLTKLQFGDWMVWSINDYQVIAIVRILIQPQYKTFEIMYFVGHDAKAIIKALEEPFIDFAKEHDCKYVEMHGRLGWKTWLTRMLNFDETFTVLRRVV